MRNTGNRAGTQAGSTEAGVSQIVSTLILVAIIRVINVEVNFTDHIRLTAGPGAAR